MKKVAFAILSISAVCGVTPAFPDTYIVTGAEPVQTYTVCEHPAQFAVNDRAHRLRSGGEVLVIAGGTATVSRSPDVFLQTQHLVRHAYQSLSASGACY